LKRHGKILFSVPALLILLSVLCYPPQQTFAQTNESGELVTTDNATTQVDKDSNTSSFLSYSNSLFGVSTDYPLGWSAQEIASNQSEPYHHVVSFFYPLESSSDKYQEEVTIQIDKYGDFENLSSYLTDLIDLYTDDSSNFRVITNDTGSILAGRPAYKFEFDDLNRDGVEIRGLEFATMIDNIVYSVSYYAEREKYNNYLPAFQKMLDSFKIFDVGLEPIQSP
jgi:serine/threonine-protein kinase